MFDKIERLLVTTDGSEEAEHAFAAMMPIVKADRPTVTVLHVLEDSTSSFLPPARVAKACAALRANGVNAHLRLCEGKPAEEIVRLSGESDLVVMSTHGRGGFKHLLLGSVTEQVIRNAEVPILVTRPAAAAGEWTRMVVALDGSPRGEQILEEVVPLARRLQASVELIRTALPPITMRGLGDVPGVEFVDDPMPYLESVKAWLATQGIDASIKRLEGRAGAEILRHAAERDATLLCMTTHGRTGLPLALLGSVADEVIRHAPCPVLIKKSVGEKQRVANRQELHPAKA
jgi:nucleotide-binding universal stress UspA family protein